MTPPLQLAASGFDAIFYLIVFVIWIVAQLGAAQRKRARRATETPPVLPRHREEPGLPPPVLREAPATPPSLDAEMRELFERMTGVPAPPPQQPPPMPAPAQMRPSAGGQPSKPRRAKPVRPAPQPVPPPLQVPAAAAAAVEAIEVAPRMRMTMQSLNMQLPKVRLPTFLTRSAVSPQSAGSGAVHRMEFLRQRGVLREVMLARAVLEPPKGLE